MCVRQSVLPFLGTGVVHGDKATVQLALQRHLGTFRKGRALTPRASRVLWRLQHCRTEALGGYLYECQDCGHRFETYASCHDANCTVCAGPKRRKWAEHKTQLLLPVPHFQVVFTLPDDLWPIAARFGAEVYGILLKAAAHTLIELAQKRWKAMPAILAVLHTWDRRLLHYPHVHIIVSAGGRRDDGSWRAQKPNFLFHQKPLRALFRGKFLAMLNELDLPLDGQQATHLAQARSRAVKKNWHVWITTPESDSPVPLVRYLARYINQGPISDHRVLEITNETVTFRTRGSSTETVAATEFIRRLTLHIPPEGFHRSRAYGLLAATKRPQLQATRALLTGTSNATGPTWAGAVEPAPAQSEFEDVETERPDDVDDNPYDTTRRCPCCGCRRSRRTAALR